MNPVKPCYIADDWASVIAAVRIWAEEINAILTAAVHGLDHLFSGGGPPVRGVIHR